MMTIEASLHAIAQQVRTLLECSDVALCLASPSEWCHPLCNMLPTIEETEVVSLFTRDENMKSIAVVPLARPAGLLGFLACFDTQSNRFLQGEYSLLEQAIPAIAREVEDVLHAAVTAFSREEREPQTHAVLQEQQTLVSLVGHDLRMPLTAIKGYAGILQAYGSTLSASSTQTALTPELQQHYLNSIMEQTQHMEVLVNDLLDVSRIQNGQLALHCSWVDIPALCRRVARIVQDKSDAQQPGEYVIRCRFDTTSVHVWADPDRVWQVLLNLLENAVKYSPHGGLIEVRVRSSSMTSSITIRDWGLGIPKQQQTSLFHVFSRGEQCGHQKIAGFGLGLYIVRILVKAMNGHITLRSSEGNGTSVSFTLPRKCPGHMQFQRSKNMFPEFFYPCEILSSLL